MRPYMSLHPGSPYRPAEHKHTNSISHECTSPESIFIALEVTFTAAVYFIGNECFTVILQTCSVLFHQNKF